MTNLQRPQGPNPYDLLPQLPSFTLSSDDVTDGERLKEGQVASGGNTSPQLSWSGAPEGTKSYVVTCFDPDAPTPSGYWHWVLVDLPADVTSLEAGAGDPSKSLPGNAFHVKTDGGALGFEGAAPPEGEPFDHRYYFAVYAVGEESLGVPKDASPAVVNFNLAFKAVGRAVISGTYSA
ncbi:YbhB/YbcL family Raf kinase inhibitor-like protein [Calidifontibacter sp. DB0510]|uniref:YbhB/YbcL family Raf kinase inhibitor-like protein n=1 Tax=Metallococcus carri TaxID=1656884 RepID=A0A967B0U4_9MICO|nr:YbhB/YbcL family Raf kinase inhibitor-like protein [Metallococcus carri]NHN56714.1 YbhB/YbcL family Raf kinase inhibitor-like protein [Metallococcus carri]NOP37909.1 YbhB/YbcL family Raf kinase inhibitor-like protein [Calidifontibacter sp. DB2511S]